MIPGDRTLEDIVRAAAPRSLEPFGLVLHHDGRWTHEGQPIGNRRVREKFERSVVYLPEREVYAVQVGRFRGRIELEEAGFFVRSVDLEAGTVRLSDTTTEPLDPATLELSPIDGALLCRVKHQLAPRGLRARFTHAAQAELLGAAEPAADGFVVRLAGRRLALPDL